MTRERLKAYHEEKRSYQEVFTKTKEKVEVTMDGWDGKSYEGEAKVRQVYAHRFYPQKKFIQCGGYFHEVLGERHPVSGALRVAFWG